MICPMCKKQNKESANFCRFCGAELTKIQELDALKKNPEKSGETIIDEIIPTTQGKRFSNFILDYIGIILFGFTIGLFLGATGLYGLIENTNDTLLGVMLFLVYYIFFETIWSKTPAKFITKTRVVMENGSKPGLREIIVRTLVRLVPFEVLSFLSSNKNLRGWHDKWSKTLVINEK